MKRLKQAIKHGSIEDVLTLWNESERMKRYIRRYLKALGVNWVKIKEATHA